MARYSILNVSKKDLSKIIRELKKLEKLPSEKKRPKHEPTNSYFYLARQLTKCMMRADALNSHIYPVRTETTDTKHILISHVFSIDESELGEFLVGIFLLQVYSTDEDESKGIIDNERSIEENKS